MTYADLLFICVKDHTGCHVEKRFRGKGGSGWTSEEMMVISPAESRWQLGPETELRVVRRGRPLHVLGTNGLRCERKSQE